MKIKTLATIGLLSCVFATAIAAEADASKEYLRIKHITKKNSYWRINEDKSVSGTPISVGGKVFEKGLGVHAVSNLTIPVDPKFKSFYFVAGPDDAHTGQIEMKVLADGKEVFTTGLVRKREFQGKAKQSVIDLTGVKEITLVVNAGKNDDKGGDHASWADAYFSTEEVPAATK